MQGSPQVPSYATADEAGLPMVRAGLKSQSAPDNRVPASLDPKQFKDLSFQNSRRFIQNPSIYHTVKVVSSSITVNSSVVAVND